MNHIPSIIENYLYKKTDYAILITGRWGSGKTHYFKNTLIPFVESKTLQINPTMRYKVIYISLYGKESIRSIEASILSELLPFFKKPASILAKNLFNMLAKTVKIDIKDIDNLIHGTLPNGSQNPMINYETVIFCFDDLERKDEKLTDNELLGFINNLVESNAKIILIANDEKLNSAFKVSKEKTIGLTITYSPILREIINDIVRSRFYDNVDYSKFLENNFVDIEEYIKTDNARTIIYALDCFEDVYSIILKEFKMESVFKEILVRLIRFTIAVAIEFKESKITYQNIRNFKSISLGELADVYQLKGNKSIDYSHHDVSEGASEIFNKKHFDSKYYDNKESDIFESIFMYITTFDKNYLNELKDEVLNKFALTREETPEHLHILNVLLNTPLRLSTDEYNEALNKFRKYIKEGSYSSPLNYINALAILYRYGNPLDLVPADILSDIKLGIDNARLRLPAFHSLDLFDDEHHILKEEYHSLVNYIQCVADKLDEENKERLAKEMEIILLEGDFDSFRRFDFENFRSSGFPYFKFFSVEKAINLLSNTNLEFVYRFSNFLESRNIGERKEEEKLFFDSVISYIKTIHGDRRKERIFDLLRESIQKKYN